VTELEAATVRETALASALAEARARFEGKRESIKDHAAHLDSLRLEISAINSRKVSLEERVAELAGERRGLTGNLEEAEERATALEKQIREQECQVSILS